MKFVLVVMLCMVVVLNLFFRMMFLVILMMFCCCWLWLMIFGMVFFWLSLGCGEFWFGVIVLLYWVFFVE